MGFWGEIEIVQNYQSIAENLSNCYANFYACADNNENSFSGYSSNAELKLDTVTQNITIDSFNFGSSKRILLGQVSADIVHAPDGKKTAYASFRWVSGHSRVGTITGSASKVLTTIPRTSSVSCNSFNIGDATTIVISRASDSFTHTLTWAFGNASGTIATKTSATTVGTTIPASSLYAQIPNSKFGVGTITCSTYSGDTLIGTSTCNFTAYAKESECIPTVSASIIDTNDTTIALTGNNTKFIKGFSNAKVTISATAKNSASISSYYTNTGDGRTSSTAVTQFNNINSKYITVTTTDSRGYPKSVDYTLDWIEYIRLAFTSITVKRPESTADKANMTIKGNYFNNSFGSVNNSLVLKYRYKEGTGEYTDWTALTPTITDNTFTYTELLENLDHNKEYTFEFMIDDELMTVYSEPVVLTKGIPVLRVGKDYVDISGTLKENGKKVITDLDDINTEIISVTVPALAVKTDTTEHVLKSFTIETAGRYMFLADVPLNYYGETGRTLYLNLKVNNTEKFVGGGVINTNAYTLYTKLLTVADVPSNGTIEITLKNDTDGKQFACLGFNLQYFKLK